MRYLLGRKKHKRDRTVSKRRGERQITHCPLTIVEIGAENVVGRAANAGSIVAAGMIGAFNLGDAECLSCADSLPWFNKASGIIRCGVVVRQKHESTQQAVGQIGRCCFLERRMGVVHKSVSNIAVLKLSARIEYAHTMYYPKKQNRGSGMYCTRNILVDFLATITCSYKLKNRYQQKSDL